MHINCLELLAVHIALNRLKGLLRGKHVLARTGNSVTVAYINRQGGLRSRLMSQLTHHSFGVGRFEGHFVPFTFQACSVVQPTSCH